MYLQLVKPVLAIAVLALAQATVAAPMPKSADDCLGCHEVEAPAELSLENRALRRAPPLYYADNKFRAQWLESWLQNPQRIRPAGDFPTSHVVTTDEGDVIDPATLTTHPVLGSKDARDVAEWLMSLRPHDELIAVESDYVPGSINPRLGAMDFIKFKGCGACHRDIPDDGGLSGPELHTAWQRLQPAFIASYIRDPSAWEPYSLMPDKELKDAQIYKLADYLRAIGSEGD